jgi:hypothetical protein
MCILLVLIHICWFGYENVGPRGREANAAQGLAIEQAEKGRARRHRRYDDMGAGPSHEVGEGLVEGRGIAKPRAHDKDMEDLRRCLEGVLDRVPEELWV